MSRTGDLLGCTSAPAFDPNLFVRGISSKDYSELRDSEFRPLADKTVQGAYPPGSTIKMSNALAALESGVMDPAETVTCNGYSKGNLWSQVPLLEKRRPWAGRHGRCVAAVLRRLLLRSCATDRDRWHLCDE